MFKVAPYGSWSSPISANHLGEKTLRFSHLHVDESAFYYTESRAFEKGRSVLIQGSLSMKHQELLPPSFNIKSRINEYGGKCFTTHQESLYFFNDTDEALYVYIPQTAPKKIFRQDHLCLIDFVIDPSHRFLYAIAEEKKECEVSSFLVRICLTTKKMEILHQGYDFYASIRVSPNGKQIAWICWNHPNMPWDSSDLWIADIAQDGLITSYKKIVDGVEESISHLFWSEDSILYFNSDISGFWNLYRYIQETIEPLTFSSIEFGAAHWIFGTQRFAFISLDELAMIGTEQGCDSLYILNIITKKLKKLDTPFTSIAELYFFKNSLVFIAMSPLDPSSILSLNLTSDEITTLKKSYPFTLDPSIIPIPKNITIPIKNNKCCYGFYYPPTNPNYSAPEESLPPLILRVHGGPTTHFPPRFHLETLFFTSRGFAVVELNYRGSTGYGKHYREAINGQWGIVDSEDCISCAHYLCKEGLAHPQKLILKGSSAGGYTTLRTLTLTRVFSIGICYYGISDLESLANQTHKFELHYLDRLIGPYPQEKSLYKERSPIHYAEKISSSLLFFQGKKDAVVSFKQSEQLYELLKSKTAPVNYLLFEEEGHGFKIDSTLIECAEAELDFYAKIFHFPQHNH